MDLSDPEAIRLYRQALLREDCRRHLSAFLREGWHVLEPNKKLEWNWHHQLLCDHIQRMIEGWGGRLPQEVHNAIINVPPGTLKSRILSVYAPAWAWLPGNWPSMSILALSVNPSVAHRDAKHMKDLITSEWYQDTFSPGWRIRSDADAVEKFETTSRGIRVSKGITSKIVGLRADWIALDDPNDVKDVSPIKLDGVWEAWQAARTRVNDERRSIRLCIQQRTHESDWTGRALAQGGWDHLCLPLEYSHSSSAPGDPRTEDGEILDPIRFTSAVVDEARAHMGPLAFAGQMNQRPAPKGGAIFKEEWWGSYDELPRKRNTLNPQAGPLDFTVVNMYVDATFGKRPRAGETESQGTSRCAIVVIGAHGPKRYVLDIVARKMDYMEHKQEIRRLRKKWPEVSRVAVEDKAAGSAIIAEMSSEMGGVIGINPQGGKESRANAMVPAAAAGDILFPREASWRADAIAELAAFPRGKHDDIVDAMSMGIADMAESAELMRTMMLFR